MGATQNPEAVVLGIDAAWTANGSTGIALASRVKGAWELTGVWDSYTSFFAAARFEVRHDQIASAVCSLVGRGPDIVAVDMPLSYQEIRCRREADDAVSRLYGARYAGTHTPNDVRPGRVGRDLHDALSAAGLHLATREIAPPCTIEVYPHPALIELTAAAMRLPYKAAKSSRYWPGVALEERRVRLVEVWATIISALDRRLSGVNAAFQLPSPGALQGAELKSLEDKIDSVVCAWVGIEALEGRAIPHGDDTASIWIPVC